MKNRTGELRGEMARADYEFDAPRSYFDWDKVSAKDKNWYLRKASRVLKACKDKGLAFVVDRELPVSAYANSTCGSIDADYKAGYRESAEDMLKANYKPIEEIDIED